MLGKAERLEKTPATSVDLIKEGMKSAAQSYTHAKILAVGIGRANVLSLPEESITEIVEILQYAKNTFDHDKIISEVSTSLIGKLDHQIDRAKAISLATAKIGVEAKFVVVGNTALVSEKYWNNLHRFLRSMEEFRGGSEIDENGDILQLALSSESLPDPQKLAGRVKDYRFPINIAWAPGHDHGSSDPEKLQNVGNWLADFYELGDELGLDSSLNFRIDGVVDLEVTSITEAVKQVQRSSEAIVYLKQDGSWHNGLFTALAEMDPVRFDKIVPGRTMAGISPKELRSFISNDACVQCPFIGPCISAGGHKIAQITLRNYVSGTNVCPSGLLKCFEKSQQRKKSRKAQ